MSSACPFCNIADNYPPLPSSQSESSSNANPLQNSDSETHLILSTEHVLAFLDIMPLTRGHVLVTSRRHFEMLGDVDLQTSQEIGKWLPILSRVVTNTVFPGDEEKHWNVVQNNGARAAQQVPHVHFHIIPRPSTDAASQRPSFAMFGRGQRDELDDEEGQKLAHAMRNELTREIKRIEVNEGISPHVTVKMPNLKDRGKL